MCSDANSDPFSLRYLKIIWDLTSREVEKSVRPRNSFFRRSRRYISARTFLFPKPGTNTWEAGIRSLRKNPRSLGRFCCDMNGQWCNCGLCDHKLRIDVRTVRDIFSGQRTRLQNFIYIFTKLNLFQETKKKYVWFSLIVIKNIENRECTLKIIRGLWEDITLQSYHQVGS